MRTIGYHGRGVDGAATVENSMEVLKMNLHWVYTKGDDIHTLQTELPCPEHGSKFTTAKIWKQTLSSDGQIWVKEPWCIYPVGFYLAFKKKMLTSKTIWIYSEDVEQISQTQKDKYGVISLRCRLLKTKVKYSCSSYLWYFWPCPLSSLRTSL